MRPQMSGARFENQLVVIDRIDDPVELRLVDRPELVCEIDGFLPGRFVQIALEEIGELRPPLESAVQALERPS